MRPGKVSVSRPSAASAAVLAESWIGSRQQDPPTREHLSVGDNAVFKKSLEVANRTALGTLYRSKWPGREPPRRGPAAASHPWCRAAVPARWGSTPPAACAPADGAGQVSNAGAHPKQRLGKQRPPNAGTAPHPTPAGAPESVGVVLAAYGECRLRRG